MTRSIAPPRACVTVPTSSSYIAFLFAIQSANPLACVVGFAVRLSQSVWYRLKSPIISTRLYSSSGTSIIISTDLPAKICICVFVCVCVIFFAIATQMWAYGGRLKDNMLLHQQSVYLCRPAAVFFSMVQHCT